MNDLMIELANAEKRLALAWYQQLITNFDADPSDFDAWNCFYSHIEESAVQAGFLDIGEMYKILLSR